MMKSREIGRSLTFALCLTASIAAGPPTDDGNIRAILLSQKHHVNLGAEIWVDFLIQNTTDEAITLFVPGTEPRIVDAVGGLPLAHVFSGEAFGSLAITNDHNHTWNVAVGYQPPAQAPVVTVGPRAIIGITLNVSEYYPILRTAGLYRLKWVPYGGSVESNVLWIDVAPLKIAQIVTDHGTMKVRFFYGETPNHIAKFIELAKNGFYNNLTFHRTETGYCIQGGCPNGDGTGIRPDGVKIEGEFTNRPQVRGSVCMARLEGDPDSASCQFFVTNTRIPEWDGRYTIFGEIVGDESFNTLDKLMAVEVDEEGRPREKLYIRSIRVSDAPRQPN